jgi:hypothetical protein
MENAACALKDNAFFLERVVAERFLFIAMPSGIRMREHPRENKQNVASCKRDLITLKWDEYIYYWSARVCTERAEKINYIHETAMLFEPQAQERHAYLISEETWRSRKDQTKSFRKLLVLHMKFPLKIWISKAPNFRNTQKSKLVIKSDGKI